MQQGQCNGHKGNRSWNRNFGFTWHLSATAPASWASVSVNCQDQRLEGWFAAQKVEKVLLYRATGKVLKPPHAGMHRVCLLFYMCFLFKATIIRKLIIMANFYWALDIQQALL